MQKWELQLKIKWSLNTSNIKGEKNKTERKQNKMKWKDHPEWENLKREQRWGWMWNINQYEVIDSYHEPSTTLSTIEETNMKQTLNVPRNCEQCRVSLEAHSWSYSRSMCGLTCTILLIIFFYHYQLKFLENLHQNLDSSLTFIN